MGISHIRAVRRGSNGAADLGYGCFCIILSFSGVFVIAMLALVR
jgi:hypothetical protein